jgi:integrase
MMADCTPRISIGIVAAVLLLVAVQTGLRLSELTSLRREDLHLGSAAHLRCVGKGRKYGKVVVMERCWSETVQRLGGCAA